MQKPVAFYRRHSNQNKIIRIVFGTMTHQVTEAQEYQVVKT